MTFDFILLETKTDLDEYFEQWDCRQQVLEPKVKLSIENVVNETLNWKIGSSKYLITVQINNPDTLYCAAYDILLKLIYANRKILINAKENRKSEEKKWTEINEPLVVVLLSDNPSNGDHYESEREYINGLATARSEERIISHPTIWLRISDENTPLEQSSFKASSRVVNRYFLRLSDICKSFRGLGFIALAFGLSLNPYFFGIARWLFPNFFDLANINANIGVLNLIFILSYLLSAIGTFFIVLSHIAIRQVYKSRVLVGLATLLGYAVLDFPSKLVFPPLFVKAFQGLTPTLYPFIDRLSQSLFGYFWWESTSGIITLYSTIWLLLIVAIYMLGNLQSHSRGKIIFLALAFSFVITEIISYIPSFMIYFYLTPNPSFTAVLVGKILNWAVFFTGLAFPVICIYLGIEVETT